MLGSIGDGSGNSLGDLGEPVRDTMFRIGKGEPDYFIVGSLSLGMLTTLALLCLLGGVVGLWLRHVGLQRAMATLRFVPKPSAPEITLGRGIETGPCCRTCRKSRRAKAGRAGSTTQQERRRHR